VIQTIKPIDLREVHELHFKTVVADMLLAIMLKGSLPTAIPDGFGVELNQTDIQDHLAAEKAKLDACGAFHPDLVRKISDAIGEPRQSFDRDREGLCCPVWFGYRRSGQARCDEQLSRPNSLPQQSKFFIFTLKHVTQVKSSAYGRNASPIEEPFPPAAINSARLSVVTSLSQHH
jgi:hypothetical protein